MDEGYIKFQANWKQRSPYSTPELPPLIRWRQACYAKNWIGMYDNGIGFGNISVRTAEPDHFYITGSATGGLQQIDENHIARVERVDATQNLLWCTGPIIASSESMSHAAIYQRLAWVKGVIHIHHLAFWKAALHQVPTTEASAPYGSPEMVVSIQHLLDTTDLPNSKLFVMEGHEEGIFAFGKDLAEAFQVLNDNFERILPNTSS